MRPLSSLRDGWDNVETEEIRLLRQMTTREGAASYLALQQEFEPYLQATESFFREERQAYLAELQRRLQRLEEWKGNLVGDLIDAAVTLQNRLAQAGIPSTLIGGLAVAIWGDPRVTRDADLKILLDRESAQRLLDVLGSDYQPLHANPLQALRGNGVLFVHDQAGTRLDLLLADTEFDEAAIRRGKTIELAPGKSARVCAAEDLILYKLISTRGRDEEDARGIVRRQGDRLDDAYVLGWLKQFEQALNDSTLVAAYQRMRAKAK